PRIDPRGLAHGAAVLPDQRRMHRLAARTDRDATVELAGDRDRRDRLAAQPRRGQRAGDRRSQRRLPRPRILLGALRRRMLRRIAHRVPAEHRERLVAHDRLEALRAEIDADDEHAAMLADHRIGNATPAWRRSDRSPPWNERRITKISSASTATPSSPPTIA